MGGCGIECAIAFGIIGKNLIRLGVDQDHAYAWRRTRKGGWVVAQSPILITTITLKRLKQRGYIAMLDVYTKFKPVDLRTAVYETRTYGGVRGALHSILGGAVYSIGLSLFSFSLQGVGKNILIDKFWLV